MIDTEENNKKCYQIENNNSKIENNDTDTMLTSRITINRFATKLTLVL